MNNETQKDKPERRCPFGKIEILDPKTGQWQQTNEQCDPINFEYQEKGYKNKQEYINCIKAAAKLWKTKQRQIVYTNEITPTELEEIMKDESLANAIKMKKNIDKWIEIRINNILNKIRKIKEEME